MATKGRIYKVRYNVTREWNAAVADEDQPRVVNGRTFCSTNNAYADDLFVVSIIRDENGDFGSLMMMDTMNGLEPSRETLEQIRDLIDHHLECHVPQEDKPRDLRHDIREALLGLVDSLGWYEQTSHSCLFPCTLENIAETLVKVYKDKQPFDTSNLSQMILKFAASEGHKQDKSPGGCVILDVQDSGPIKIENLLQRLFGDD